jgi:hypothetical protein
MRVYVALRGPHVDASWAAWWRAQARAIAHVAHLREPNEVRRDAYIAREMAFAKSLDGGDGLDGRVKDPIPNEAKEVM